MSFSQFFDRMRLFETEKASNRQELEKKTKGEVEEKLLKQLASQYKLRLEAGDSKAIEKGTVVVYDALQATIMEKIVGTPYAFFYNYLYIYH